MASYTHETIVITKEAWKFLRNFNRKIGGFRPVTDEMHERTWSKLNRNYCANPVSHPIGDDEIRIYPGCFEKIAWDEVKDMLIEGGLGYRDDGFRAKGMYI